MKNKTSQLNRGFTLIELLVVIAVIAILAALLFPAGAKIMQNAAKKRAFAELNQVATAIDSYKNKLGFYPPDNPNNYAINLLYYELLGATTTNISGVAYFVTLDQSSKVPVATFGATGIMNWSAKLSSDDGLVAQQFLRDVKPSQYATDGSTVRRLGVQIDGPNMVVNVVSPFRYNSSSPVNNVNSYDLWVDIVVGGKTNRISNWNPNPQIL